MVKIPEREIVKIDRTIHYLESKLANIKKLLPIIKVFYKNEKEMNFTHTVFFLVIYIIMILLYYITEIIPLLQSIIGVALLLGGIYLAALFLIFNRIKSISNSIDDLYRERSYYEEYSPTIQTKKAMQDAKINEIVDKFIKIKKKKR